MESHMSHKVSSVHILKLRKTKISGLSMKGVQLHSHVPTHTIIYLGVLLLHVQDFTWWVNCKPALQQMYSVILLQIIHLQLQVEFLFVEIHCNIITLLHSLKVNLFQIWVVFSYACGEIVLLLFLFFF